MKVYKRLILVGLIAAMTITTVACSGEENVENTDNDVSVETTTEAESVENTEKAEVNEAASNNDLEYEFYEINEKPEILKEFTNMDADYKEYLKSSPFRALFLDKDKSITDEIDVYTLPEMKDSTALYIYQKNNKVINARLDEFNGDINIEGYDYDTLLYNYDNNIENQMKEADFPYDLLNKKDSAQKELKAKFEGKSLNELNEYLKVYTPVQRYIIKDTDKTLEVYTIVSEVGYTASNTINVIIKDNTIEKLYIDESYRPSNDPIDMLKGSK